MYIYLKSFTSDQLTLTFINLNTLIIFHYKVRNLKRNKIHNPGNKYYSSSQEMGFDIYGFDILFISPFSVIGLEYFTIEQSFSIFAVQNFLNSTYRGECVTQSQLITQHSYNEWVLAGFRTISIVDWHFST